MNPVQIKLKTYLLIGSLFFGLLVFSFIIFRDRLYAFAEDQKGRLAQIEQKKSIPQDQLGQVLAEVTTPGSIIFNVDAELTQDVEVLGVLRVQGQTVFDQGIEAPNVVYSVNAGNGIALTGDQIVTIENNGVISLQGLTGDIQLTAGEGIEINGTTISATNAETVDNVGLENAFRTVLVSGQSSVVATGADSLTFVAGSGIELITDATGKSVQITSTVAGTTAAGWQDNGSSVVLSTLSDLVGIGIDTPTAALDVNGSARLRGTLADENNSTGSVGYILTATASGVEWQAPSGGVLNAFVQGGNSFGENTVLGTNDTNALLFETNGLERIRITSGGNVGIGVSTPGSALSLPAATSGRASLNIASGVQPVSGGVGDVYVGSNNLYFHNGSVWEDLTNYWSLNGTDLYYNAGELGLGIASPDEKLEVYQGNIRLNTGGTSDGTERKLTWYDSTERWSIGYTSTDSDGALRITSAGTNVFAIDDAGNVGIGVTSPTRKLDVSGSMRLASSAQPSSPVSGDIYNDGSNLFFYDGLEWVELTSGTGTFWNQNGSSIYYSGGNVGIGTNSPSSQFAVGSASEFTVSSAGNITTSGSLTMTSLSAGGMLKVAPVTGVFDLATPGSDYEVPLTFTNGLTRTTNAVTLGGTLSSDTTITMAGYNVVFGSTGNVGIQQSSPTRPLDINGILRVRATTQPVSGLAGDIYFDGTSIYYYDGTGWNDLGGGGGSSLFTDSGLITYLTDTAENVALGGSTSTAPFFFDATNQLVTLTNTTTGASFRVNDQASDTTPFIVDASGNVGIGTTTAPRPLTVNGAMRLATVAVPSSPAAGDIYSDGTNLYFHNGTAFQNLSTGATLWQQNSNNIYYNTGRVGVGTTSPLSEFQVEASADPEIRIVDTGTATSGFIVNGNGLYSATNTGSFIFRTGVTAGGDWTSTGSERLRIASSGNVGIGNTNPQRLLHVGGAIRLDTVAEPASAAAGDIYSSGTSVYFFDGTGWQDLLNGGGASIWTDSGTVSYLTQITDDIALGGSSSSAPFFFDASAELLTLTNTTTGDSFRVNDQASDTTPFVINASGLVGIGTTNPGSELDVNGTFTQRAIAEPSVASGSTGRIYFDSTTGKFRVSEAGNAYIDLVSGAASTFNFGGNTFGALASLGTNDNYNLAFETNNSVRMTVETTGDVGIGTTNPAYKLDVVGAIRSTTGGFVFPDGSIQLTAAGAGGGYWAANSTHIYNINAGNVGIGVPSPAYKLDVSGAGRFTGELILAGNITNNVQNPIISVHDSNSSSRSVLQLSANTSARNYFLMTSTEGDFSTPTLSTVGIHSNLNLALTPKGGGNVIIGANDLLFSDTLPVLQVFNSTNGNYRSVLELSANTTARNYFRMTSTEGDYSTPTLAAVGIHSNLNLAVTPKGGGNVIIGANDLAFNDTAPELLVFNSINNNHRSVLQLTADSSARNYFRLNATEGQLTTPTISTIGAWSNINLGLAPKGSGNVIIESNNLLFTNTAPKIQVYNSTNGSYRDMLEFSADTTARNYFRMTATEGEYSAPSLSVVGPWSNINLGLVPKGAGALLVGGSPINGGKLNIHGTAGEYFGGAHQNFTISSDNFPTMQTLNFTHDNIGISFDAYYNGAWRSSDAGSNFQIYKINDHFNINYASGVNPGSGLTFQNGFSMDTSGFVGIGHNDPDSRLHIANNASSGAVDAFSKYQILLHDSGTATSSYGVGVEANTLWFNSGGSDFKWYAVGAATPAMFLDSGNLGIGTTGAPGAKLHIVGSQFRWDPSTTSTNSGILFVSGGDDYAEIRAGRVGNYGIFEPLVLNSSPAGYIGVGTTAPRASLDVAGNVNTGFPLARMGPGMTFSSTTDNQAWIGSNGWMWGGGSWTRTASTDAVMWGSGINAGAFEVWTIGSATAQNTAPGNANSRFFVGNTGNVGVGTVVPGERLEVNGNLAIANNGIIKQTVNTWGDKWQMAGADIKVSMNQANSAWQFDIGGTTGLSRYRFNATNAGSINGPIVDFNTNGTSTFYGATAMNANLTVAGNLGVGTVSPATNLTVFNANTSTTQTNFTQALTNGGVLVSTNNLTNGFTPGIFWNTANNNATVPKAGIYTQNTASGSLMYFGTSNNYSTGITNNALVINQTGNVGIGTTAPTTFRLEVAGSIGPSTDNGGALGSTGRRFTEVFATNGTINTSDVRLKENVQTLEYGLDELLALDTISYTWKGESTNVRKLGLIAQDVQQVMPEVVHIGTDANQTLGVYYSDLIPVTIRAIQQQQAQIDSITGKASVPSATDLLISSLEEGYSRLDTKATELQTQVDDVLQRIDAIEQSELSVSSIAALEDRVATNEQKIASLEAELASVSARLTDSVILNAGTVMGTATESAFLTGEETIVKSLLVSDTANINNLSVSGTATVGLLSIEGLDPEGNVRVDTLGGTLKIQSLKQGAVELMGGEVTIDTDGNMLVAGSVTAEEVKTEELRLDVSARSAGTATLPVGEQTITIPTALVTSTSRIMITETTETFSIFVVPQKQAGESFTVKINGAKAEEVTFDWILVNE